ncbi:MAG: aminoacetone oxidase family FAD-binding enzyme [Clostridia bacterium]|nr:aminoacetone oxidase family FAD-binding enzyme [Clostridia bacterium]
MDIAIIGAGASGMMAAIAAARRGANVMLFEKQARAGKKLLATGNGRCNLTNLNMSPRCYHGSGYSHVKSALEAFGVEDTLSFFQSMGLLTISEENGRVYPASDRANSVLDVLRLELDRLGIAVIADHAVEKARFKKGKFLLDVRNEDNVTVVKADKLIVCCGGSAAPKLGGTTDGYAILESFGHAKTKIYPSLVRLTTDPEYPRAMKGIRLDAEISIMAGNKVLAASAGEIQFTENGVSGPAAFEVSRAASTMKNADSVQLDLLRSVEDSVLLGVLHERRKNMLNLTLGDVFTGIFHSRVGKMLVRYAGLSNEDPCSTLNDSKIKKLISCAHAFILPLRGTASLTEAQVTAGGIDCALFDETMQSMLCPGLYAAGEVLDVDGDCGGYNLQWAWSSGYIAGTSAAQEG